MQFRAARIVVKFGSRTRCHFQKWNLVTNRENSKMGFLRWMAPQTHQQTAPQTNATGLAGNELGRQTCCECRASPDLRGDQNT